MQRSIGAALLALGLVVSPLAHAQTRPDPVQQTLNDAASALQKGLLDQAIQFYTDALADKGLSNDRRAIVHTDRGAVYMRRQSFKLAIDDFNRAVQLSPEYAPSYNNRGNALIAVGALKEAVKDFDRAIVLSPNYGAAFANRASAQLRLGSAEAALADYTRAIELAPQSVSALNGRGLVHLQAERAHAAARDFTRALTLDLRFAPGYRNRAAAMSILARPEDVVEDLSRAITFDAKNIESHLLRGEAYLTTNDAPAAIKDFNRVIELSPRSATAFIARAIAHVRAENSDEALNDLTKAIELDPKLPRAYAVRAWIYKQLSQLDLAQKDMERALKLEPLTADALWAQGEVEDARGRSDAAVQAFTKALGLEPRHRQTLDALTRLGLVATREETELVGAGADGWRVFQSGELFSAANPQFTGLKVPLEMLGKGTPRVVSFERQKAPFAGYGLLRFAAGKMEAGGKPEDLEAAAILDLQALSTVGLVLTKRGGRSADLTWDDGRVTVTGADGTTEDFVLKGAKGAAIAAAGTERSSPGRRDGGQRPLQNQGGAPAWSPWAQGGGNSPPPSRQASQNRQKPKTLFEMLFGN